MEMCRKYLNTKLKIVKATSNLINWMIVCYIIIFMYVNTPSYWKIIFFNYIDLL